MNSRAASVEDKRVLVTMPILLIFAYHHGPALRLPVQTRLSSWVLIQREIQNSGMHVGIYHGFLSSWLPQFNAWLGVLSVPTCGRLLRSTCRVGRHSRPPLSGALDLEVYRGAADDCSVGTCGSASFGHIAMLLSLAWGNFRQHQHH